ncbi:MAG TPA: class I SAM-dependent methyltransferase [Thiobacillus sp.]
MKRLPISLQSLAIQSIALMGVGVLNHLTLTLTLIQPHLWQLAVVQGGIAALLSRMTNQPAWWPPLHFMFFPAILMAQLASVPAWVYLAAFLTLVMFFWSTFRTRVPLYLSDRKAWQAVVPLLPGNRPFRFIDLGSGLGDVPLFLESRFPQGHFFGTEIAPAPWLISWLRGWLKRSRVTFMRRDYSALNLADFDVVFAFLSPAAMPGLWEQAQSQMKQGSVLISLSFGVQLRQPDHTVALADGERHTLYAWTM